MSEPKLKPCPFCGSIPAFERDSNQGWTVYLICQNLDCPTSPATSTFRTENEATAAWNTRPVEDDLYAALYPVELRMVAALIGEIYPKAAQYLREIGDKQSAALAKAVKA